MKVKELILFTPNLKKQFEFYTNVLELKVVSYSTFEFSIELGNSILTFKEEKESKPVHFALNIPSNKAVEALGWLKKRVTVLPFDSKDLVDFTSWNAKAIYFYDRDNNIVEFIVRKNLDLISQETFTSSSILNISEVGLPTYEMKKTYAKLNELQSIPVYSGSLDRFCAVGSEEGMFIMVNPLKKKWFPNDDEIFISDFEIKGDFNFKFSKGVILTQ